MEKTPSCLIFKNNDGTFALRKVQYDNGFFSLRTGLAYVLETFMPKREHATFLKEQSVDFIEVMAASDFYRVGVAFPETFDFSSEGHSDFACIPLRPTVNNHMSWPNVLKEVDGVCTLHYYFSPQGWCVARMLAPNIQDTVWTPLDDVVNGADLVAALSLMHPDELAAVAMGGRDPVVHLESSGFDVQRSYDVFSSWRQLPADIQAKLLEDEDELLANVGMPTIFAALEKMDPFERRRALENSILEVVSEKPSRAPKIF